MILTVKITPMGRLAMYKEGFGNIPNKDKIRAILDKALRINKGKWVIHSHIIGKTAENIASEIGLDPRIALACGSLHDIGKGYGHEDMAHMMEGFRILRYDSYFFPAKIALSHGFVLEDINSYHGRANVSKKDYDFIRAFLKKRKDSPYDKLIILLDNLIKYEYLGFDKRESQRDGVNINDPLRIKRRRLLESYKKDLESKLQKPISAYLPRPRYYKFPYSIFRK